MTINTSRRPRLAFPCFLAIACVHSPAVAQINFEQVGIIEVGVSPSAILAADLNSDGDLDLVTTNGGEGTLSLLLGVGDGTFEAPIEIAVGGAPRWVCAADFNRDGRLDLAVADFDGKRAGVLYNLGSAEFTEPEYADLPLHATSVIVADLDGDRWLDLVVSMVNPPDEFDRHTLAILFKRGNGGFHDPVVLFTNLTTIMGVQAGDLDHDGDLDLVLPNHATTVLWMINDRFGRFDLHPIRLQVGASRVVPIDLNGDGFNDVAGSYYSFGSGTLKWVIGRGDGTFVDSSQFVVEGSALVTDLKSADLNGDGTPDFFSTRGHEGDLSAYRVIRNNGDTTMTGLLDTPLGESLQGVALGDFNGDGLPDSALADAFTDRVHILLNATPRPLLANPVVLELDMIPRQSMRSADIDGDGHLDIVALLTPDDGQMTRSFAAVFFNNGQGGFASPQLHQVGAGAYYLDVGDLNGDARPDIVVSNAWDSEVSILLNAGDGNFHPDRRLPIPFGGNLDIAMSDMDNDAHMDIVVVADNGSRISVAFQDAEGAFEVVDGWPEAGTFRALGRGDFNEDGFIDVVAGMNDSESVGIFLNSGERSLGRVAYYETGRVPRSLAVADFDDDGHLDVAAGIERHVSVLYGLGDGTFRERVQHPLPFGPRDIKAVDLNNDGLMDIVAAEGLNRAVNYLINDGEGGFHPGGGVYATSFPAAVATGDFDGDGDHDVAIVSDPQGEIRFKRLTSFVNTTIHDPGSSRGLHLRQTRLVRGQQAQLVATQARGSERVYFLAGTRGVGAGPHVPLLGGLQLDIRTPIIIVGDAFADALGTASLQVQIAPGAPTIPVGLQAVARRGPSGRDSVKSNALLLTIE